MKLQRNDCKSCFEGKITKNAVLLIFPQGGLFKIQNYTNPNNGRGLSLQLVCIFRACISLPSLVSSSKNGLILEFIAHSPLLSKEAN